MGKHRIKTLTLFVDSEEACESVRSEGDSGINVEDTKDSSETSRSDCQMFKELDTMGECTKEG